MANRKYRPAEIFPGGGSSAGGFDPHVAGIDYGVLDRLIGYGVRRAQIAIYDDFIRSLAAWDITPPRFSALTVIEANPDLKLTELATVLGIARSGAVLLVDALQRMALVERRPAPADKRAWGLHLTPQGAATLAEARQAVLEHDARMAAHLSTHERQTLLRLLHKLAKPDG
ncbi:MAG: MarR family winged helix-turn-helix transcriptional regulator [Burkholderiaceae bacterium]